MSVMSLRNVFDCLGPKRMEGLKDEHLDRCDIPLDIVGRVQTAIRNYQAKVNDPETVEETAYSILAAAGELEEITYASNYGELLYMVAETLYDHGDYQLCYLFCHSAVRNMNMFGATEKEKREHGSTIESACDIGCKALFWIVCKHPSKEGKTFLLQTMDLFVEALENLDPEQKYSDLAEIRFQIAGNYAFYGELDLAEREYAASKEVLEDKHRLWMHHYSITTKIYVKLSQLYYRQEEFSQAYAFSCNAMLGVDIALDFEDGDDQAGWKNHIQEVHSANVKKLKEIFGEDVVV